MWGYTYVYAAYTYVGVKQINSSPVSPRLLQNPLKNPLTEKLDSPPDVFKSDLKPNSLHPAMDLPAKNLQLKIAHLNVTLIWRGLCTECSNATTLPNASPPHTQKKINLKYFNVLTYVEEKAASTLLMCL